MSLYVFLLLSFLHFSNPKESAGAERNDDFATYYYSSIQFVETPLSPMLGSISLQKDKAMQRYHYRFIYDELHRLQSVSFYNGETPRHPNHTANLFTLAHRMDYAYTGNSETIRFYDEEGRPRAVLGDCYAMVYSQNELGFRNQLHFLDKNGNKVENSWGIYFYQWDYQNDGSVIENRFNQNGEGVSIRPSFEFHRLRLRFNHLGQIALMQNIDEQGRLVENQSGASQDRITMNAEGNFLEWNVLNNRGALEKGNGPDVAIGKQSFNAYGYEIGIAHQDEQGKYMENHYGIIKSKTQFDRFGNMIERRFFNENDQPTLHARAGYHKLIIHMDESGNLRKSIRYFDLENRPTLHQSRGYHAALYEYNQQNRLIQLNFVGLKDERVNRKDSGIAYIHYRYDQDGNQIQQINYNKKGKVIQQ